MRNGWGSEASGQAIVRLEGITKRFGDLVALDEVDLEVGPGEVHAIVGANGSGKSTLVKVIGGVYTPDAGTITLGGKRLASLGSPAEAAERGVRVVHQEAPLVDTLSVAEVVALFTGYGARSVGRIRWRELRERARNLLQTLGVAVDVGVLCADLGPADRAGVALGITFGNLLSSGDVVHDADTGDPCLIILDEVTASIPEGETVGHLAQVRRAADLGLGVIMITHRLGEVRAADRFSVLREGRVVYSGPVTREVTEDRLVGLIVGDVERPAARSSTDGGLPASLLWAGTGRSVSGMARTERPALSVENLTGNRLAGVSFQAWPGEVVGFAGLKNSGLKELPEVLGGAVRRSGGQIRVNGRELPKELTPHRVIGAGIAMIPADRLRDGGVASLSVAENVVLPEVGTYWHRPARRRHVVNTVIDAFDVRPRDMRTLFGTLSGGNQQKILMGKWLLLAPSVLVLDDPTYGVDPGARELVFSAIKDAASKGVAVLFFSTEPEQIVRLCSRAIVLRSGRVAAELSGSDLSLRLLTRLGSE